MATRPFWTGHIRLSLVSFEVQLYPATRATREFPLHQIDKKSGERIRYQTVVPGKGVVPREEIVKGYEYEKDHYVLFTPDELKKLRLESKHTIELVQFVDRGDIDLVYFEKPYFVAPGNAHAEEAYRVVRDALRETKKYGIGQITLAGKERLAALKPCGKGLMLETLRYGEEVRDAQTYFTGIEKAPVDDDQLSLAKELIERKAAKFEPGKFKDHYDEAMRRLVAEKMGEKGAKAVPLEPRKTAQVINLMDALKRSLGGKAAAGAKGKAEDRDDEDEDNEEKAAAPAKVPAKSKAKPKRKARKRAA